MGKYSLIIVIIAYLLPGLCLVGKGLFLGRGLFCRKRKAVIRDREITMGEQKLNAEKEAEERKRELKMKVEKRIKEEAETVEFEKALQLCQEKSINFFNYVATQEKENRQALLKRLQFEQIKEYWLNKNSLSMWKREHSYYDWHIVHTSTCISFDQFNELAKLLGTWWFSIEAQESYIRLASNAEEEYQAMKACEDGIVLNKTRITKENITEIAKRCIEEYQMAINFSQLDEVFEISNKIISELLYMESLSEMMYGRDLPYQIFKEKAEIAFGEAEIKIIEKSLEADPKLLGVLVKRVNTSLNKYLGDMKQKYIKLNTKVIEKILRYCNSPRDINNYEDIDLSFWSREVLYNWYEKAIANCKSLNDLQLFVADMNPEHQSRMAEEINKKNVQLKIEI